MKTTTNGYRVILFRQTEQGYDVISPYQINEKVSKEVYQAVKGVIDSAGYVPGGDGKQEKEIERLMKERKKHLDEIKNLQRAIREVRAVVKGV